MMDETTRPRNRVADRIIRARGEMPAQQRTDGGNDAQAYVAAVLSEGFPHMAFSLFCANGKRHVFFYHNIDNLDLTEGTFGSYITLSHRGKLATLRGSNLHGMLNGMVDHTLQTVYEFDPAAYPDPPEGEPMVDFVDVVEVNAEPPEEAAAESD